MSAKQQMGRRDQAHPWVSMRTKANLQLALVGVWAVVAWHLAVAIMTPVPLSGWSVTADAALEKFAPVAGLPGQASTAVLVGVWLGVIFVGAGLMLVPAAYLLGRWRRRRAGKGMADRTEVREKVGLDRARQRAQFDQPSLADGGWKTAEAVNVGLSLGSEVHSRQDVIIPASSHMAVIGPTGAQKTNSVVAPACLEAPGALVVTTNESGIIDLIYATRSKKGKVWVFDPDDRTGFPDPMTWDPILGALEHKKALSRALAFADGCAAGDTKNGDFFRTTAATAFKACLHAAELGGREMDEVLSWCLSLGEGGYETPYEIITGSENPNAAKMWAKGLKSVGTGADDTVASTRTTLTNIIDPMLMPSVTRWVARREGVPNFDPDAFVRSNDTLVLVSDASSSTNVGPLCTMLFREVIDAVKRAAPFLPGRTLDPFLRVVGDEIANVAPIQNLAATATEIRKLGVQMVLVFQSLSQLKIRWATDEGNLLLEQMGAELVLPGLKDLTGLERYSGLAGMADVLEGSVNVDSNGIRTGQGFDVRERKVARPEEIREIADGRGLLVFGNAKAMMLELRPWYAWSNAAQLKADSQAAQERRIAHQRSQVGGDEVVPS